MIKQAERIESILHNVINKAAKVAVSITKAIVTLVCLGASVSYRAGIKAREIFDTYNDANLDANNDVSFEQEVNVPSHLNLNDVTHDAVNCAEEIVDVILNIRLVKPVVNENPIHNFVSDGLQDTLINNYLELVSYKHPRNRRTKKAYVRHNDIGILKEHYQTVKSLGILES